MTHLSCDYVVPLQLSDNSNAKVPIQGCTQDFHIIHTSAMSHSFLRQQHCWQLCCSGCVWGRLSCVSSLYFIKNFITHRSCDYVMTLKHTENFVIQASAQNYDFFHTSISSLHDAHLISELLNRCIAYCFFTFYITYMTYHQT